MRSIRVFLVATILAAMAIFNFVAALQGYQSSMERADKLFDGELEDMATLIANIHSYEVLSSNTDTEPVEINPSSSHAFQIWQDQQLIIKSSNAPSTAITSYTEGFNYSNFNGYRWRTISFYDHVDNSWILVAERSDLRFTLAENVVLESILPILLGLPIIGLLIWLIVTKGLTPLKSFANDLSNKQPSDLSPLIYDNPKRELKQIILSTNELLLRLDSSLQREKRFTSDAAHELRTPISVLKVQLFNLLHDLPNNEKEIHAIDKTVDRLGHIIEQILTLYRSSPDQYSANFIEVDFTALIQETIAKEHHLFENKHQQIEFNGSQCSLISDHFSLTTLLQNLLHNANKYTPEGGQIKVGINQQNNNLVLTVEDSGIGIPHDQYQRIFERFHRIGGDQHNSGELGCGIGLAIVKHIVDLHKATIQITPSSFSTGTAFHISFPMTKPR